MSHPPSTGFGTYLKGGASTEVNSKSLFELRNMCLTTLPSSFWRTVIELFGLIRGIIPSPLIPGSIHASMYIRVSERRYF